MFIRSLMSGALLAYTSLSLANGKASVPPASANHQAPVSAEELLAAADRARGAALEGLSWDIIVDSKEADKANSVQYHVKAKAHNALAEATQPARNRGETMLFNDRSLWFFKPGLKKPMPISSRQKLMGQAANGDIASTNYFRDYRGKIVGEELIGGVPSWKLELKAKANNVTYDGIRYWIAKDKQVGVKAEFLTVSGEVFKTATFSYENKLSRDGKTFPFVSKMVIHDPHDPNKTTIIRYQEPSIERHADSIFNINNVRR